MPAKNKPGMTGPRVPLHAKGKEYLGRQVINPPKPKRKTVFAR